MWHKCILLKLFYDKILFLVAVCVHISFVWVERNGAIYNGICLKWIWYEVDSRRLRFGFESNIIKIHLYKVGISVKRTVRAHFSTVIIIRWKSFNQFTILVEVVKVILESSMNFYGNLISFWNWRWFINVTEWQIFFPSKWTFSCSVTYKERL